MLAEERAGSGTATGLALVFDKLLGDAGTLVRKM
jgi:hypothetical protein